MGFGITGIEHGSLMDEESAEMFEQTGTYLVPTFSPFHEAIYPDPKKMAQKSPEFQRKLGNLSGTDAERSENHRGQPHQAGLRHRFRRCLPEL